MSEILSRAKENYSAKLNAPKRVVKVPEWGYEGKPLEIYVKPATLFIRDKVYKAVTSDGGLESLVDIIILRALDADDIPLFTKADKQDFMNTIDPDVIIRVATAINDDMAKSAQEQLADIEKN